MTADPHEAASATGLDLRGSLDSVEPDGRVFGWCWSPDEPRARRPLLLLIDGVPAAATVADVLRDDLLEAGIGDGGHGFVADIPRERRAPGPAMIGLRDEATGRLIAELPALWAEQAAPAPLAGNIDLITADGYVSGWCWEPGEPERRILLDVMIDDTLAGTVRAEEPRPDLQQAELGDGRYGFTFLLPYELLADRGTVRIHVAEHATGRPLGEDSLLRLGRRSAQEARLLELERQVALMQTRLEHALRASEREAEAESRAASRLFATVGAFFQNLAEGVPATGSAASLAETLATLRRELTPLALRAPAHPVATLAVAPGSVADIHACLAALHEAEIDAVADIVLLDPGRDDPAAALLPALVANLRSGPAAAAAVASFGRVLAEADTRFVALVDPRVRVRRFWLDALAATLEAEPRAALAGSTAERPDGLLHHAGLELGHDRRLRELGRLAPARLPEHRFLRPVDALAPLALLVRPGDVAEAGGLDAGYASFAAAIADLCLRLRERSRDVLLQPGAAVVWAGPEATAPDPEDFRRLGLSLAMRTARAPLFVGQALVVDARLPVPDRDAGSVETFEQMLVLRRLGWGVLFAAAQEKAPGEAERRRLERAGIEVADPEAGIADLLRTRGRDIDLVHLHRHVTCALVLPLLRELAPGAKIVFSPADLHFLREQRQADVTGDGDAARIAVVRERELACVREADATLLCSDHERDLLEAEVGPERLHLLRWIARATADIKAFPGRDGLVFVGNFRHAPNVDAVLWYARDIHPLLFERGIRLDVIGADPPPSVLALEAPGIRVRGWVEDLEQALGAARLSIAPIRYGAGFKGKIASSLAAGLPVVATPVALEGTGLADGDGVALADDPAAFAAAILRLHDDEAAWRGLSARATERVGALYAPSRADAVFRALLADLGLPTRQD